MGILLRPVTLMPRSNEPGDVLRLDLLEREPKRRLRALGTTPDVYPKVLRGHLADLSRVIALLPMCPYDASIANNDAEQ
jgi:hypothetical protein